MKKAFLKMTVKLKIIMGIGMFVFFLFILSHACKFESNIQQRHSSIKKLVIDPSKAKEYSLLDIVDDAEYTQLHLPEKMFLGNILKVVLDKSSIFLFDYSNGGNEYRIVCFDQSGEYCFVIDRTGNGPGEYTVIYDFDITGNNIVLSTFDKLMYYDRHSGDYKYSIDKPKNSNIQMISMLDEKTVLTNAGRYKGNKSKNQIKVYNLEKQSIEFEALPFDNYALKLGNSK